MWRDASVSLSLSHSHLPLPSRTLPSLRNKPLPSGCCWPNHPPGVSNLSYVVGIVLTIMGITNAVWTLCRTWSTGAMMSLLDT